MRIPFLQGRRARGRVGIELGGNKLALVYYAADAVQQCRYEFVDDPQERQKVMEGFVSEFQLKGTPCTLVLHPRCYQMLLTDCPEVEEHEIAEALPWKVKDLLHYPVDDVYLQHFLLPEDAFSRRQRMLYVVAVAKATLLQMVDMIEAAGLALDSIDVADLVLVNGVMAKRNDSAKNTAVLYLDNRQGLVCIAQQESLYLSRGVDMGLESLLPALKAGTDGSAYSGPLQDQFLLDIQRSMDYYESQQGKGPVATFCCLPMGAAQSLVTDFLAENLSAQLQVVSFDSLLNSDGTFSPEEQQHGLLAGLAAKRWMYHSTPGFQMGSFGRLNGTKG